MWKKIILITSPSWRWYSVKEWTYAWKRINRELTSKWNGKQICQDRLVLFVILFVLMRDTIYGSVQY
jgi:hypothetical protein